MPLALNFSLSVFAAFTFSQAGMVVHWLRERGPRWLLKAVVNGVGATVTGLTVLIELGFLDGRERLPGRQVDALLAI